MARRSVPLSAAAVLLGLAACGDGGAGDAGRFCARVEAEQAALSGGIVTPLDASAAVTRYQELADLAPLAIRDEWAQLTAVVEAAATADVTDPAERDRLTELAYGSEQAARTVDQWVTERCGVRLRNGPAITAPAGPGTTFAVPPTAAPTTRPTVAASPPSTRARSAPATTAGQGTGVTPSAPASAPTSAPARAVTASTAARTATTVTASAAPTTATTPTTAGEAPTTAPDSTAAPTTAG
jgi:hypothetical protein